MDHAASPCHCLLCQDPRDESAWDAWDRTVAENVRGYGWHVAGIFGDPTEDWAYSIGLWHSLRSPEVCVVGPRHQAAMRMVNILGEQVRDGQPFQHDERRLGVIENHPVTIRRVHPSWYRAMFGAGCHFAVKRPWPMVQAVLPDMAGRFPWEDGVDEAFLARQPFLWLDRAEHPAGPWTEDDD